MSGVLCTLCNYYFVSFPGLRKSKYLVRHVSSFISPSNPPRWKNHMGHITSCQIRNHSARHCGAPKTESHAVTTSSVGTPENCRASKQQGKDASWMKRHCTWPAGCGRTWNSLLDFQPHSLLYSGGATSNIGVESFMRLLRGPCYSQTAPPRPPFHEIRHRDSGQITYFTSTVRD